MNKWYLLLRAKFIFLLDSIYLDYVGAHDIAQSVVFTDHNISLDLQSRHGQLK